MLLLNILMKNLAWLQQWFPRYFDIKKIDFGCYENASYDRKTLLILKKKLHILVSLDHLKPELGRLESELESNLSPLFEDSNSDLDSCLWDSDS